MSETEGDFDAVVYRPGEDPAPEAKGEEIHIDIEEEKPSHNSDIVKSDARKKDDDEIEVVHEGDDEPKAEDPAEKKAEDEEEYSKRVQRRIDKMTKKLRETERKEREAREEAEKYRQRYEVADNFAFTNFAQRASVELSAAQREYTEAYRMGDEKAVLAAHERLNKAQFDVRQAETEKMRRDGMKPPAPQQQQQQAPQQQRPPEAAQDWIAANKSWFGDDSNDDNAVMTAAAYAIDARLSKEGWDPSTEEFYEELDARLKRKFQSEPTRQTQSAVAPPSRGAGSGGKPSSRVTLSKDERSIAAALGISERDYAIQKRREAQKEAT